jgi:hypothetical protein
LLGLKGFTAGRPAGADLGAGNEGQTADETKCSESFDGTILRVHNSD